MQWWQILLIVIGGVLLLLILSILFYRHFFKRFWDMVLSGLAIIALSPLLIILTIAGAIAMKGNPFFTQERVGKKKKNKETVFRLIKFRTMSNKKDNNGDLLSDEQRLNKYGRFLRSTSLDELPELINVFFGKMSIIGPRPLPTIYLPYYKENEKHRHDIRPGLSGLAQINGRNSISWEKKFEYDLKYVSNVSLILDLKIILLTVLKVLKKSDIGQGENRPISLYEERDANFSEADKGNPNKTTL